MDYRKAEVADTVCPDEFPLLILVADMDIFRCVVFELASTSKESAVAPSRGIP